jgi:predicted GIY-YIG superfamily endonuclease
MHICTCELIHVLGHKTHIKRENSKWTVSYRVRELRKHETVKSFEETSLQREKGFTYRAALDVMQYRRESRNFFINIYNSSAFKTRFFSYLLLADDDCYYCGHGNVNRNKSQSKLLSLTLKMQWEWQWCNGIRMMSETWKCC